MLDLERVDSEKQVNSKNRHPEDSLTRILPRAIRMAHEAGFRHYEIAIRAPDNESRTISNTGTPSPISASDSVPILLGDNVVQLPRSSEYIARSGAASLQWCFRIVGELERTRELIFSDLSGARDAYSELPNCGVRRQRNGFSRDGGWMASEQRRPRRITGPGFRSERIHLAVL